MKKLYKVTKIFDKKTSKVVYDTRMCGQPAFAFVPNLRTQRILRTGTKAEIEKYAADTPFDETWLAQDTLEPVIGFPMYFSSVKFDAGFYRSSKVYEVAANWNKTRFVVQTEMSVLYIEEDV